ncbi:S24 family peptidase [Mesorhizobium sp. BE184]|uniref:S24 family peptidase n=1 Tax=Mesorhizobium sp. BE184 TaxID=2817714 RepID=UPI002863E1DC|nr:S24 family peptidase [Mesorhizobium sp. BE184]MDR7034518.1 phage repressor protein C with HTH and peptisase S24 domain [Mesorhizobium sp. BE184]
MSDTEITKRLRAAREAAGYATLNEAALALGIPYATMAAHENGSRGIGRALSTYVERYGVSSDWLLRGVGEAPASASEAVPRPKPNASFPPVHQRFPGRMVPLLGQTVAGANGRFILNGQEIAYVFCPPMLEGVDDAYAVQVYGTSMEPRFFAGETVWLNPRAPVRAGDFVVAQIIADENEAPDSYIKQFISNTSKGLRLRQLNPDEGETEEMFFDADSVFTVHKIVFQATT